MRVLILPLAVLTLATPAYAREPAPEEKLAERLNDPVMQDRVAGAMSGMMGAILDLRVGEMERAIDPDARVSRNETLRDRATRDDPYFEERMTDRTRAMTGTMGAMATGLVHVMPELRRALADMAGRMAEIGSRVSLPDRHYDLDD